MVACARHSGIGEGAMRTKLQKTCFFNALLLTISDVLYRVKVQYLLTGFDNV